MYGMKKKKDPTMQALDELMLEDDEIMPEEGAVSIETTEKISIDDEEEKKKKNRMEY